MMKTNYFLAVLFSMAMLNISAQYTYGFEDCETNGSSPPSSCNPPWSTWGGCCDPGCTVVCGLGSAHSGDWSGGITDNGTADALLNLGSQILGEWGLEFWMYVPSGKEAYWNLQGVVPVGGGEWIVGNIFFNQDTTNPTVGLIDDSALGPVIFNFPHDVWFRVAMNFDLTGGMANATWGFSVDNTIVIPEGIPFTNFAGIIPTSLGGVDFFSISQDNVLYLDDFNYINGFHQLILDLGIEDMAATNFSIYPIPVQDLLLIDNNSTIEITSIKIYDVLGRLLLTERNDLNNIDVSHLNSGVLFVEIETDQGVITKKIIKE